MDPESFRTLERCVAMVNDLIRDMEANREVIGNCVGQDAAKIYCSMCDGAEQTLYAVGNDLQMLQRSIV